MLKNLRGASGSGPPRWSSQLAFSFRWLRLRALTLATLTHKPDGSSTSSASFTVQSNIIVLISSALIAVRVKRQPTWVWVLRLDGVACIAVTFVVFHLTLASLQDLDGLDRLADVILHTVSPILCVLGWLLFGPRGRTSWRVVRLSLAPTATFGCS